MTTRWRLVICALMFFGSTTLVLCDETITVEKNFQSLELRDFPEEIVVIDFDVAPDGRAVVEGQDFSDLYAPVGVRFSSSIDDAVISATKYRVRPCKGFSAGNSEPLYRGTMTVHFYVPGMKKVPGAVHFVAFYAAYVTPNSLSLTAYGLDGKLLGEVRSEGRGSDFLGLHSKAPISRIEIENDETLHKGYVIDDLRFDSPTRLPSTPIP